MRPLSHKPPCLLGLGLLFACGGAAAIELATLQPPTGVRLIGATAGEQSATSAQFIGDVNGDGRADLAIGAPERTRLGTAGAGVVYVLFGRSTPFSQRDVDLGNLGGQGFTVLGPSSAGSRLGTTITPLGDFNGDGLDDFAIGAPVSNAAAIYIVFGTTGFPASINLDADPSNYGRKITVPGSARALSLGRANLNNDIFADLLVGEFDRAVDGVTESGRVTAVFGQAGGPSSTVVAIDTLTPSTAPRAVNFRIGLAGARLGRGVAGLGDFNGDGVGDAAFSAHNADSGSGRVYVVFGRNNTGPTTLGFAASEDLESFTTAQGLRFDTSGTSELSQARLGWSIAAADLNGDARPDLLAGAPLASIGGRTQSGALIAIYGTGTPAPAFARGVGALVASGEGIAFQGMRAFDGVGEIVAALGDVDGDGRPDVATSAPLAPAPGDITQGGYTLVLYGRTPSDAFPPLTDLMSLPLRRGTLWSGEALGDQSGSAVSGGDFDGDGRSDLTIGARLSDGTGNADAGVSYLILHNRRQVVFCDGFEPGASACEGVN